MNNNERINVIAQAFYGNRVETAVKREEVDNLILGYPIDFSNEVPIDRTVIHLPNENGLVIVYNKHHEEEAVNENNNITKPLAIVPELNIELYGRCIACRIDENGELASIENGDYEKIIKYFAE